MSQLLALTPEQTAEMAMVDLAHAILVDRNEPITFHDLLKQVAEIKNMNEEELQQIMVQFYTEVNLDGRFVNVGNSTWGLKKWYPVEQYDDVTQAPTKGKRKLMDDDYDDLEYDVEDVYEDVYEDEYEEEEIDPLEVDFEADEVVDEEFLEDDDPALEFEADEESFEELVEEEVEADEEEEI